MKKNMRTTLVLLTLALALSVLAGCQKAPAEAKAASAPAADKPVETSQPAAPESAASPKAITLAMISAWDTLVPFESTNSFSIVLLDVIYDRLFYQDDDIYTPRLATGAETNADATEITIHLRDDAKWSDGEPVTASDVVFSAQIYASPAVNAVNKSVFSVFKGYGEGEDTLAVEALDGQTVRFQLKESTNLEYIIANVLSKLYIIPEHLLSGIPREQIRTASFWNNPVSSGPGVLERVISGERAEFSPNPYYYRWDANWDRFVIRVVPAGNLLAGLLNGEVDAFAGYLGGLTLSDWEMARKEDSLIAESIPSRKYTLMTINTSKPYLTEGVRHAINLAANRQLIIDGLLGGQGLPAFGELLPTSIYYNPVVEYEFNPDAARALLEEEGWDSSRVLVMGVPTGNAIREQAAIIVQQNLLDVGIKAEIQTYDFATHVTKLYKGDYDFGFISSTSGGLDPSVAADKYNPDSSSNYSQVTDRRLYDTAKQGKYAFTSEEKLESALEYQNLLKEIAPAAYLYFDNLLVARSKRVEGPYGAVNTGETKDIWNWKVLE